MILNFNYHKLILPLKLLASIAVVWLLIAHGMLDMTALLVITTNPTTLAAVTGLVLLTYLISAYRWRLLLKRQNIPIPVRAATSITFLSFFMTSFLPGGGVAGDIARIAYVTKLHSAKGVVVTLSVFVDRLLGLYALLLVALAVALLNPAIFVDNVVLRYLAVFTALICIGVPFALYLFYSVLKANRRFQNFMKSAPNGIIAHGFFRFFEALRLYRNALGTLLAALSISVLNHAILVVCIMILGSSMNPEFLSPINYAFAAPWAWLANLMPVTPGGLGVGEAAFDRICHLMEPVRSVAAYGSIFFVYRIAAMLATLPGLVIYFVNHDTSKLISRSSAVK